MAKVSAYGDKKIAAYVCRTKTLGENTTSHYVITERRVLVSFNGRKSYTVAKALRSVAMREGYLEMYNNDAGCERLAR